MPNEIITFNQLMENMNGYFEDEIIKLKLSENEQSIFNDLFGYNFELTRNEPKRNIFNYISY